MTSSPLQSIESFSWGLCRVTTILGVRDCLTCVLGREKVHKPKPDPDIYLEAAKELGVPPERRVSNERMFW